MSDAAMSRPAWLDETKTRKATFADGYSGFVIDLGDGTCRFANAPLLGENSPKWGDRVDLFYNPCKPFERPRVGYRVYAEGEEPVGRHFGREHTPSPEEIAEHEREEEEEEERHAEAIEEHYENLLAPSKLMEATIAHADALVRYGELAQFVASQGVKLPDDLHSDEARQERDKLSRTPTERKKTKLFLLATADVDYEDVDVTEEEVSKERARMRAQAESLKTLAEHLEQ